MPSEAQPTGYRMTAPRLLTKGRKNVLCRNHTILNHPIAKSTDAPPPASVHAWDRPKGRIDRP